MKYTHILALALIIALGKWFMLIQQSSAGVIFYRGLVSILIAVFALKYYLPVILVVHGICIIKTKKFNVRPILLGMLFFIFFSFPTLPSSDVTTSGHASQALFVKMFIQIVAFIWLIVGSFRENSAKGFNSFIAVAKSNTFAIFCLLIMGSGLISSWLCKITTQSDKSYNQCMVGKVGV